MIVPTGQRAAHRPQRMQRVSSFSMADPVTMPSSSAATSSNSTPNQLLIVADAAATVSGSNSIRSSDTSSRQFSGQTSTQPPQRMHMLPSSAIAFEDRVDPAVQAALRFLHRRLLRRSRFRLPSRRCGGRAAAWGWAAARIPEVQRHGVALEDLRLR